jgi:3-methylcrotonyl-CoA carboxylase beta subunit
VPQIAGVFGDCIAGGGYMPIISDRVYMTEQAYMVIAGAALIKGAKSQKITSLDIGGPEVHVHQRLRRRARARRRDAARLHARDVARCRARRRLLPRHGMGRSIRSTARASSRALAADHREAYDALEVLARLTIRASSGSAARGGRPR